MTEDQAAAVHEAIKGCLADNEVAVSWVLTIDVLAADGCRYLAHRAGGGYDGTERPMAWTALGMHQASATLAEAQLLEQTRPEPSGDDE